MSPDLGQEEGYDTTALTEKYIVGSGTTQERGLLGDKGHAYHKTTRSLGVWKSDN